MKTGFRFALLFVCIGLFNITLQAQRPADDTGVGVVTEITTAPSEPDWKEWRDHQDRTVAATPQPAGPPADYQGNPVDWFIAKWLEDKKQDVGERSEDHLFMRKAYLDVIGLLPPLDRRSEFLASQDENKREKLIDSLLADDTAYSEHWMTFWNDLLRNDEQTNIDNLRGSVTDWLFHSLKENRAYDIMVAQLLNPSDRNATGFLKGINWRGRINASQRPVIQAAQNVGQVFLATTLKCASCHNHFTKPYKLTDTYGLASFFSEEKLEIYRCDKLTGEIAHASFPLPGGEDINSDASLIERREAAVRMVTSPKNPRFAQAIVNRLWHKLNGRGMFEPVDDLDAEVFYPEMLEWLAYDFMANGYDMKHTLRLILTSSAYAMQSASKKVIPHTPDYAKPSPRRMSSEQLLDSIAAVTGHYDAPDELFSIEVDNPTARAWRYRKPGQMSMAMGRPNREQVVSARDDQATILQMLEMVNGEDLTDRLIAAAEYIYENNDTFHNNKSAFIRDLFLRAYSRLPNEAETKMALEMFGISDAFRKPPTPTPKQQKQNIEDFLWIVFMNPEFQFIH